jgi:hypothetical protein
MAEADHNPEGWQPVRFPDVTVQLSNEDGNVFAIIGRVSGALRRAGHPAEADAFAREAMAQPSYDAVLQLVMRTVETF